MKNKRLMSVLIGIITMFCFIKSAFASDIDIQDFTNTDVKVVPGQIITNEGNGQFRMCYHASMWSEDKICSADLSDSSYTIPTLDEVEALDSNTSNLSIPRTDSVGRTFTGFVAYHSYGNTIKLYPFYTNIYEITSHPTNDNPTVEVTYPEESKQYEWICGETKKGASVVPYFDPITTLLPGLTSDLDTWKYSEENDYYVSKVKTTSERGILYGYFDLEKGKFSNVSIKYSIANPAIDVPYNQCLGNNYCGALELFIMNYKADTIIHKYIPFDGEKTIDIDLSSLETDIYKFIVYEYITGGTATVKFNNLDIYSILNVKTLDNETAKTLSDSARGNNVICKVDTIYENDIINSKLFHYTPRTTNHENKNSGKEIVDVADTSKRALLPKILGILLVVSGIIVCVIVIKRKRKQNKGTK